MGFSALIAGGIGAIGSIGSSLIGSKASKDASNAQVAMQQQGLAQQKEMFGVAQDALNPFIKGGQSVLPTLQGLITPGPNQNALLSQTPGFQFANQYGNMAATNALASRGLGASAGPVATAAAEFSSGLASNTWQSVVNALQNYGNMGASSANTLASGAIASGNAQAGTLSNIGGSQASGILGSANALSSGVTGVTNALSSAALLNGATGGGGLYSGIQSALANKGLSNSVSNGGFNYIDAQAAAKGGHTSGKDGGPFIVGENGPEIFVPDGAGTIVPYKRLKKAIDGKNCLSTRGLTRKLGVAA